MAAIVDAERVNVNPTEKKKTKKQLVYHRGTESTEF